MVRRSRSLHGERDLTRRADQVPIFPRYGNRMVAVNPALVRSVEIVLNWRYLVRDSGRFDCCSGYLIMRGDEPNPTSPEEACAIISAILETFVPQERRKLLTITLTVPCVRYELPHNPLVVLGNLVLTLKEMGFHIYVMCAEVDEICVRWKLHEKCYQWPGNDWTHLFDVSKEEWDERVRKKEIFVGSLPPSVTTIA